MEWLTQGSHPPPGSIKRRLLREGLLVEVCAECGQEPLWNGKPLVLQMDHINGDPFDYRIENLRMLCPNCHTQTLTFTGRSRGRYAAKKAAPTLCRGCGQETSHRRYDWCWTCAPREGGKPHIVWPGVSELEKEIAATSVVAVARRLGVSDNAVRKHIVTHKV